MVSQRRSDSETPRQRRSKPATTPEARENQLIALAVDLAEKQMREGKASAQVISHFLKLGSTREQLEQERLARENELLKVKSESMASSQRVEELIRNALDAMRSYTGQDPLGHSDDFED